MKKLTVLTALLILVSILNPTFGQWGRSRKTITTKDTGDKEVVIPLREPEKVITPETTSSKALTVADLLVRFEKLEQRQTSSEKSIISIKKEQKKEKKEKKSMLDSILALSNAHKNSSSALQLNLNNLSAEIKKELASSINFMVALKNRADSGDIEAQKHYAEFEEINKNIQSQEWYNVLFLVGFIAIVIVVIVIWRQKVKMRITLDEIKNGSDPDHLNYQSRRTSSSHDSSQDSYGWKPGSRGPEPEHKSKEREEHSVN